MNKVDFKQQLKHLYNPSAKDVTVVEVPPLHFLMIDGAGNPNTAITYKQAVEALFAVSYALKFMVKKGAGIDYGVMPLEGLWWADDMTQFNFENKDIWKWTALVMQPDYVTDAMFKAAREQVAHKKDLPALGDLRFSVFHEGQAAQIMYLGPYAEEGPTIAKLHHFIDQQGGQRQGKHHEIYLSDPSHTAPQKLKTVIRQPFV
jgi:hypothetical protein